TAPTTAPAPVPSPDGRYSSQCDYVLGDFTENTPTGYRLVAGTTIHNTGNVGIKTDVVAHWLRLGTSPVTEKKQVQVPYKASKRVNFTVPIDQNTLDLIQAAQ